jgi:hypothetical protein
LQLQPAANHHSRGLYKVGEDNSITGAKGVMVFLLHTNEDDNAYVYTHTCPRSNMLPMFSVHYFDACDRYMS